VTLSRSGGVTQSWIECLVALGHALNSVMYPWIWRFETPRGQQWCYAASRLRNTTVGHAVLSVSKHQ